MDDACVIGGRGMVGQATAHAFSIPHIYDLKDSNITLEEASKKKYIFICLPTPTIKGRCVTDDISSIIKQLRDYGRGNIFIVRSTVPPGFCRSVNTSLGIDSVVHNPEFLSESTWKADVENPDLIVVGADNKDYREAVENLYLTRYKTGSVDIITTDSVTSELIKWAINGLYSTKVVFANEIYDFAKTVGANYETIKNAMYKRKWIGKNHLDVWYREKRGVRGKCLPKDLEALAEMSDSPFFKLVEERNKIHVDKKE